MAVLVSNLKEAQEKLKELKSLRNQADNNVG
jgi:hypothetical protein